MKISKAEVQYTAFISGKTECHTKYTYSEIRLSNGEKLISDEILFESDDELEVYLAYRQIVSQVSGEVLPLWYIPQDYFCHDPDNNYGPGLDIEKSLKYFPENTADILEFRIRELVIEDELSDFKWDDLSQCKTPLPYGSGLLYMGSYDSGLFEFYSDSPIKSFDSAPELSFSKSIDTPDYHSFVKCTAKLFPSEVERVWVVEFLWQGHGTDRYAYATVVTPEEHSAMLLQLKPAATQKELLHELKVGLIELLDVNKQIAKDLKISTASSLVYLLALLSVQDDTTDEVTELFSIAFGNGFEVKVPDHYVNEFNLKGLLYEQ